jgi:hypothetical protein
MADLELRLHYPVRGIPYQHSQHRDLVLSDTMILSFQAPEQDGIRLRGHSKAERPDLAQAVLGRLLLGHDFPSPTSSSDVTLMRTEPCRRCCGP